MKKTFFFCTLLLVFSGCANPYAKFYNDLSGGINVLENPNFIIATNKPKLVQGSDTEKDTLRMMEEGYVLLGVSSFNAGNVNQRGAANHAAKVHADTVIVYNSYTGTVSGSMPLTMPNTQSSYHLWERRWICNLLRNFNNLWNPDNIYTLQRE